LKAIEADKNSLIRISIHCQTKLNQTISCSWYFHYFPLCSELSTGQQTNWRSNMLDSRPSCNLSLSATVLINKLL